ncbi:MAG: hypothetical protein LBQ22_07520 [Bacteroidales bacterium]|jgi:hypothetical protein|nr:hypothetical protein [Bacteroidales bacterium]
MKNIKKFMIIAGIIVIAVLSLSLVSTSTGNEEAEKFLTVKVVETQGAAISSFIIIVDENGKQETVELTKLATKRDIFCDNVIQVNQTLNSIGEKGYKLVGQSGGNDQFSLTTVYTFVKK